MSRLSILLCALFVLCAQSQEPECVIGEVDLAIIIDASNSIGFGNFRKLKGFLNDFLSHPAITAGSVRIASVSYSTNAELEFLFKTYDTSEDILAHIKKIKYLAGATNTAAGLEVADNVIFKQQNGDRDNVPNFILLISDGKSNINKQDTIPNAQKLKEQGITIFAICVGKELEKHPEEIKAIVTSPAEDYMQMITDYATLLALEDKIFKTICPVIEEISIIKDGKPCRSDEEGKVVEKRCRTFKCIEGTWRRIGYTGCPNRGRCLKWDAERTEDCYQYKCFKSGSCEGDLCQDFDYRLVNAGCMVGGQCVDENKLIEDKQSCSYYQCVRRSDGSEIFSEYIMVSRECVGPDGTCRPLDYKYSEHCIIYECQASQYNGIMEANFVPTSTGCKYNSQCVPLGGSVMEVCDELVCGYDDVAMGYEMMLVSQGCEHNGKCLKNKEKVFDDKTCTNYICSYSKRENRLVMKERVAGCKGGDSSCAAKGDVVTERGCIKYECNSNGQLTLVEAGCDVDGVCKAVGSSWRLEGECAVYRCVMGESSDDAVETNIEKDLECHDFNGNCMKPNAVFEEHCIKYRCKANGKLERIDAKCEYGDKCYNIGDDWVDMERCKHVFCKADSALGAVIQRRNYGCKDDDNKCYAPGQFYQEPYSCIKYRCYEDKQFRIEECEYKGKCYQMGESWTDMDDCLTITCARDEYSGEPVVYTSVYGCMEEGICKEPGEKYQKDCQTYECQIGGRGFQIVDAKCPWRENCKSLNQTWFDKKTCRKYGCFEDEDGIDIEEITYGCRGMNDECLKDDAAVGQDQCISYECDNGVLRPTKIGCETEYGCMNLDEVVVDEEKCIKYKCVMSESGDGYIATKIKEVRGCLDHDRCYFPGAKKQEECSTFVCKRDGTFELIDPQCDYNGRCLTFNSGWDDEEQCKKYHCTMNEDTGLPYVKSWVWALVTEGTLRNLAEKNGKVKYHAGLRKVSETSQDWTLLSFSGCRANEKCHKFGKKRRLRKCVVHECQNTEVGPTFVPVKIGCVSGKRCRKLGADWVNKDECVREACEYEEGAKFPQVFQSPYGCFDENGNCHAIGTTMNDPDNECIKYECTGGRVWTPISTGCFYNDKCKKAGTIWNDRKTCTRYTCIMESVTPSKVIMRTKEEQGCRGLDDKCLRDGETSKVECTEYVCDPSMGGLVITNEGCMNGDKCMPKDSTWLDPSSCITYQCLYDPILNDLFITEKQYGCQENDQCYSRGEKKQDGCNKFVCNAKGDFQVIKAGCEKDGKCYNIDDSWSEGCVSFTCALLDKGPNYVQTEIIEHHGCVGSDGKCYVQGETYQEGCISYTCQKGGKFVQEGFGCVGFDGECVLPGSTVMDDCNEYQCDEYTKFLQPVNLACNFDGVCKNIDSKWFDEEDCKGYKCVYDPEKGDVEIVERISGCQSDGKCMRSGAKQGKDCVEFECRKGVMVPTKIGCEHNGQCLPVGETDEGKCSWVKCVIDEEGPDFIETRLVSEHGCFDCYGNCHWPGDEFVQGCKSTECLPGGFTRNIMNKCMTPDGYCIPYNEVYNFTRNGAFETYICGEMGNLIHVDLVKKCSMSAYDEKEFDIGAAVTMNCITYRCVETVTSAHFVQESKACIDMDDGSCHSVGSFWSKADGGIAKCFYKDGALTVSVSYESP